MSDQFFMYALAKTDAALGKFADAQNVATLIVTKKPEIKTTEAFQSTVAFVKQKMKEKGVSGVQK
jgi:hypothetical protein